MTPVPVINADRLAAAHQRAGISGLAGSGLDRHRFARDPRLVEQYRALDDAYVAWDEHAERQVHHVARHQHGRGQLDPFAVAPDPRAKRQPLFEELKRSVGTALLEHAEGDVENQKGADHQRFDIFPCRDLQDDRRFEHPRHRRPEVARESYDGMLALRRPSHSGQIAPAVLRPLCWRGQPFPMELCRQSVNQAGSLVESAVLLVSRTRLIPLARQ